MYDYKDILRSAGFSDIQVYDSYDVFKDARIAKSAETFGAKGYNIRGYK
jgi:hypothetical protein